jgi:hypothetical protein
MTAQPLIAPRLRMGRSCTGAVLPPLCLYRRQEWPFYALCFLPISHFITWYPNDIRKIAKPRIVRFLLPLYYFILHMAKVLAWTLCSHSRAYTVISIWQEAKFETHTAQSLLLPVSLLFLCVEIWKRTILNWLVARILHIQYSLNFSVNGILCFTVVQKYWNFAIFSPSLLAICINVLSCIPVTVNEHEFSYI